MSEWQTLEVAFPQKSYSTEIVLWKADAGQVDPEELWREQEGLQLWLGELRRREKDFFLHGWFICNWGHFNRLHKF